MGQASLKVTGSGEILGATIEGLDLARPLADADLGAVLRALGQYGVIRFARQRLSARDLKNFSARFGRLEINVANRFFDSEAIPATETT
jgi:taurine dioxygenase